LLQLPQTFVSANHDKADAEYAETQGTLGWPQRDLSYGNSIGSFRPSSACGQGHVRSAGSNSTALTTSARSRSTLAAKTRNTSSCVTPSPSSTPASVSVTREIDV